MDNIAKASVKILADPKTSEGTKPADKYMVGSFIKNIVAKHAMATLTALEGQMSQDEKEEMKKYMAWDLIKMCENKTLSIYS